MHKCNKSNHDLIRPIVDDSELPIALRKGVRSCTKHPIGNYIAYEKLLPPYSTFVSTLDDTQAPSFVQEALNIPTWKQALQDEIRELESNNTCILSKLPLMGRR